MTLWRILNSKILIKAKVVLVRALETRTEEWTVCSTSHNLGTECLTSPGGLPPGKEPGAQWLWGPTVGVLLCYVALCELTIFMTFGALTSSVFGLYYNLSYELWSAMHLQGPHFGTFHFNPCGSVNVFTVRGTLGSRKVRNKDRSVRCVICKKCSDLL